MAGLSPLSEPPSILKVVLQEPIGLDNLHHGLHPRGHLWDLGLQLADDVRLDRLVDLALGTCHHAVRPDSFRPCLVGGSTLVDPLQQLHGGFGQTVLIRFLHLLPQGRAIRGPRFIARMHHHDAS